MYMKFTKLHLCKNMLNTKYRFLSFCHVNSVDFMKFTSSVLPIFKHGILLPNTHQGVFYKQASKNFMTEMQ